MPEFTVNLMGVSYRELRIQAATWERAKELAEAGDPFPADLKPDEFVREVDFSSQDEQVQTVESYEGAGGDFRVTFHYSAIEQELNPTTETDPT